MSFGHGGLDDELMICSGRCHRLPHLQRRWATQSSALRAGMIRGDRNQGMNPLATFVRPPGGDDSGDRNQGMNPLATIARPPGEGGLGNLSASFKRRRVRKRSRALRAEAIVFWSSLGEHTDEAQWPWDRTLMVAAGASNCPTRLAGEITGVKPVLHFFNSLLNTYMSEGHGPPHPSAVRKAR